MRDWWKRIGVAAGFLFLLAAGGVLAGEASRQIRFHDDAVLYPETAAREERVTRLSEQLKIRLDPALEHHRRLIERADRLIVFENCVDESGWIDGEGVLPAQKQLPENTVCVYTGEKTVDGVKINAALVDDSARDDGVLEVVVQLQPETGCFPHDMRAVSVVTSYLSWVTEGDDYSSFYFFSDAADCWLEKRPEGDFEALELEYFPAALTRAMTGEKTGRTELIQIWGEFQPMVRPGTGQAFSLVLELSRNLESSEKRIEKLQWWGSRVSVDERQMGFG